MSEDASSSLNVIAVAFGEDANAFQALTSLKELDSQRQVGLAGAAVVERAENGEIVIKDQVTDNNLAGTTTGGIVGLLIGILGGPFGVLIGGATGVLIGSLFDSEDADETESVLAEMSSSVRVGHDALLAEVSEQSPEVVDAAMARLGGTVLRRAAVDVEAEVAAAEHAHRAAKRTARKELLEARHHQHVEQIRAKLAELRAKLDRHKRGAATRS
jgi:uncharacterized membrane protein